MTEVFPAQLPDQIVLAKRTFVQKLQNAKKKEEKWTKDSNEVYSEYLKDVYNINVPADFPNQLEQANNKYFAYSRDILLSYSHLDAIVQSCIKWLEYLENSKEVFDQLVCNEVLNMVRIHTSVISGRTLGNQPGIRLKKAPPHLMVTIVNKDAGIRVIS